FFFFFFSSRRRHTRFDCDWSSDVCSSDLVLAFGQCDADQAVELGVLELLPPGGVGGVARVLGIEAEGGGRLDGGALVVGADGARSEERRVGNECRARGAACR